MIEATMESKVVRFMSQPGTYIALDIQFIQMLHGEKHPENPLFNTPEKDLFKIPKNKINIKMVLFSHNGKNMN